MTSAVELLFSVTIRVSVLIVLAWGAAWLLRRRSAALRHLVWSSAAIGALVLAAAAPFAPTVETTRLPVWQNCTLQISPVHIELPVCGADDRPYGPAWTSASARDRSEPGTAAGDRPAPPRARDSGPTPGAAPPSRPATGDGADAAGAVTANLPGVLGGDSPGPWTLAVALWAAGALAVLLMVLLERLSVRRITRSSREAGEHELLAEARQLARDLGLREEIDLQLSPAADSPLSWGLWRPRIMLPANADEWPEDARKAVLLHELGHARRRDVFTQTLAALACAVFWFNPLVWLAAGRMRDEREHACDDLVLQSGVGSTSYAQCLLDLTRRLSPSSGDRIALVGMTRGPDLAERVDRLVSRSAPRQPPGRTTTFVSALAALALLGTLTPHVIARPDCQGRSVASSLTSGPSMDVPASLHGGDWLVDFGDGPPPFGSGEALERGLDTEIAGISG